MDMHSYCLHATYSHLSLPCLNHTSSKKDLNSFASPMIRPGKSLRNARDMVLYSVDGPSIDRLDES
jgi:hypothetical protein